MFRSPCSHLQDKVRVKKVHPTQIVEIFFAIFCSLNSNIKSGENIGSLQYRRKPWNFPTLGQVTEFAKVRAFWPSLNLKKVPPSLHNPAYASAPYVNSRNNFFCKPYVR